MRSNNGQEARHINGGTSKTRGTCTNLKVLIESRCLGPLSQNEDVGVGHGNIRRRSYSSYQKLPQLQYLKLSVLKLDGSAFGDSFRSFALFALFFFRFFLKYHNEDRKCFCKGYSVDFYLDFYLNFKCS